ncbi:MAG: DNA polymerase III subunit gamma/tau [Bacteroidota bacterium]|nr:DNA polymerase III subunit gamma/tau [Bacteroidota bacterium]
MSNSYRALTRKYRPQSFKDIVSQEHVSSTLLNAVQQNRLSHAYMFCGPRGVGKTTMARVLARVINSIDDQVDGEALNQTLNIIEIDAASNNKVEDVHHLRESVRIPPQNGRYKIFIVDEVHMLSKAAFNALLKTLEEPPEHAIFIFATTEPHKVLSTILSRVQRFDFKRISVDEIVQRLEKITTDEGISIDHESLHVIAKKADGALRDALGLLDQAFAFCGDNITYKAVLKALNVVDSDRLFEFMACVTRRDTSAGLHLIHTLLQEGYDIQEFLVGLVEHLRNLYVAKQGEQMILIEASADTKANYFEAASTLNSTDIMRYLYLVSEQQVKIRELSQPRIAFELMFLKMAHMEPLDGLKKLIEGVKNLPSDVERVHTSHSPKNTDNDDASLFETRVGTTQEKKQNQEPLEKHPATPTQEAKPSAQATPAPAVKQIEPGKQDTTAPKSQENVNKSLRKVDNNTNTKNDAGYRQNQLSFDKIIEEWPSYLKGLEGKIPKILELQVERVKPVELLGDQLILECDNPLSKQMLDQQARELSVFLKDHIGVMVQLQININDKKTAKTKEKNPYDLFKKLVQKDPIFKDIVDKLGAELEY